MSYFGVGWLESNESLKSASLDTINATYKRYLSSPVWLPGWMLVAAITHIVSGYVTAFYAKKLELMHGALVGALVGLGIFNVAVSPVALLACVYGAHLRKRHAEILTNAM
jgi:hypothetical protein